MAYGLEFYGANNQLIFDTDNFDGGQTLVITESGSIPDNDTYTAPSNSLTFGRVDPANGTNKTGNLFGHTSTSGVLTNKSGGPISYIKAEFTSSNTPTLTNGGEYGLEIFDSSGGLMFSTRKAASTVNFQAIYDKGDLTTDNVTNSVFSGDPSDVYVSIDYMYYANTNNYANGYTFTTSGINYRGKLFTTGQFAFNNVIPNIGTLAVIKLRS
jgi:hypothetical protein